MYGEWPFLSKLKAAKRLHHFGFALEDYKLPFIFLKGISKVEWNICFMHWGKKILKMGFDELASQQFVTKKRMLPFTFSLKVIYDLLLSV